MYNAISKSISRRGSIEKTAQAFVGAGIGLTVIRGDKNIVIKVANATPILVKMLLKSKNPISRDSGWLPGP